MKEENLKKITKPIGYQNIIKLNEKTHSSFFKVRSNIVLMIHFGHYLIFFLLFHIVLITFFIIIHTVILPYLLSCFGTFIIGYKLRATLGCLFRDIIINSLLLICSSQSSFPCISLFRNRIVHDSQPGLFG